MKQIKKIFEFETNPYIVFGLNVKRASAIFLQAVIVFTGIFAIVFMLWEPHLEGRNAHSTIYEVYFNDPFLAFAYVASIPFYIVLYKAVKVVGYYKQNKFVSLATINSLRTIKYCALTMLGFAVVGEIIIMLNESDDRAGGVFIGFLIILMSFVIAVAAAKIEKNLKNSPDEIVSS